MKNEWNQFLFKNNGSFLQSYQWGEFQKSLGRSFWRIEEEKIKALVIKYELPLVGNYLYCPRGPVEEPSNKDWSKFLGKIKQIAEKEKSIFFKVEPPCQRQAAILKKEGFVFVDYFYIF